MKSLSSFVQASHLPESLIRAVVRQIGGWGSFKESAHDIVNHGIDCGFSGFIYYNDTVKFTRANKDAILARARDVASDLGEPSLICFLGNFRCLKSMSQDEIASGLYDPTSEWRRDIYNALAWFAGEEVAHSYCDAEEQQ